VTAERRFGSLAELAFDEYKRRAQENHEKAA